MAYAALLSAVLALERITHQDHFRNLFTMKQQIKTLHEKFNFLQAFLEDDPPKGEEETDYLESQIREVAYRAEDIIEFLVLNQTIYGLYQDLQNVGNEVDGIVEEVMLFMERRKIEELQSINPTEDLVSSSEAPGGTTTMVGFDDDQMEIKEQLCGGPSKLQIIPIVGMGGIGKTALATNVFYDSLTAYHFHIRSWATITQDHKVRDILLGLLHSTTKNYENSSQGMGELAEFFYKSLKGRKYLIVLDDIWSKEAWDDLKFLFPDDHNGSRIMLTTRLVDVAVYANSSGTFRQMQFLNEEQSWKLLQEKVFGGESCPFELEETGKLIARNCRGLPLSIILVSGLLSKTNQIKYQWENIARDISLSVAASNDHLSSKILSLSYYHLPCHLKPCFLYMGGFPEDYEIPVFKLISSWVAEGFLKPTGSKCLEDVAEEYLEDLVKRSLVLVTKKRSNGKSRFCSIHDLLRDLCIKRSRYEKFLHPMDGIQENIENKRRLSFSKSVEWFHFKNTETTSSYLRSIFCCSYNARVLTAFKLLKVLHILEVHFESFPVELLQLSHLRFLAFTNGFIRYCTLPLAMPTLQNLQTLIVGSSVKFSTTQRRIVVPLPIWKMPQLRHFVFPNTTMSFPSTSDQEFPPLENLQTLSRVRNFRFTKEAIEMIPNLKKLKLLYTSNDNPTSRYGLNSLVHLHQLETLNLIFHPSLLIEPVPVRFAVPLKLKKLTLRGCGLSWEDTSIIGSLPNLEVLKLRYLSVMGTEWEPVEGEFPKLKFLLLERLDIKHWVVENTHFPRLEQLIIRHCSALEKIPSVIGEIMTLEVIEVGDGVSSAAAGSAREILDEQRSMGNDVLQVRVGSHCSSNSC